MGTNIVRTNSIKINKKITNNENSDNDHNEKHLTSTEKEDNTITQKTSQNNTPMYTKKNKENLEEYEEAKQKVLQDIKEEKERHETLKEAYPHINFSTNDLQRNLDFWEKKISKIHEEARHRREKYNIKLLNKEKQNKNASPKLKATEKTKIHTILYIINNTNKKIHDFMIDNNNLLFFKE